MAEDATAVVEPAGADTGKPDGKPSEPTTPTTYTEADVASRTSAAVNEALKAERAKQAALLEDKDKDSETKIAELSAAAASAQQYADFVDSAAKVGVKNLKAAYLVAQHGGYIDKKGALSLEKFRADNPEFFSAAPDANAGRGAGTATAGNDMDAFLRRAAGRG
jgi:hypothetical protein